MSIGDNQLEAILEPEPPASSGDDAADREALKEELRELRQKDPAAFAELVSRIEFEELKEDPEFMRSSEKLQHGPINRDEYVSAEPGSDFGPED